MRDSGVLVIGLGNELCGDDAAGVEVARLLRGRAAERGIEVSEHHGEPLELLDEWQGRETVVLVDTMRSGAAAGVIRRFDASTGALRARSGRWVSTHALSLDAAVELGRALKRLPARVIVYAIEGRSFRPGSEMSRELNTAIPLLAEAVLREARTFAG